MTRRSLWLGWMLTALLSGCLAPEPALWDQDQDGFARFDDCDDTNPNVNRNVVEFCDGADLDNDCDGLVDSEIDADGDGADLCADCDESDASRAPALQETCDGVDNDCDEEVDEDLTEDADSDGRSAPGSCLGTADDCDDGEAARHPGLTEVCDGLDNDCDEEVDEGLSQDVDGDGVTAIGSCEGSADDCNDDDPATAPGAVELCDDRDNDCDGAVDEELTYFDWYLDNDGDGYGVADSATDLRLCDAPPPGYAIDPGDCDDGDDSVNPGATEQCGSVDRDCDAALPTNDPDLDVDGDGFDICDDEDCDDSDASVFPGAIELCDGVDADCDGLGDDLEDGDGDGSDLCSDCDDSDPLRSPDYTEACDGVLDEDCDGLVDEDDDGDGFDVCLDCDDLDPANSPGAGELCDGQDNNCDGVADEDADGDGVTACAGDCDDADPAVFPGAVEVCNGVDDSCDGLVDGDADGDGITVCEGDCDDTRATVFPGATPSCDGSLDDDCDGAVEALEADGDGDGLTICDGDCDDGDPATNPLAMELCDAVDRDCDGTADDDSDGDGVTVCAGDCDDGDPATFPAAVELCDGADNDCDGDLDEDEDGDGVAICEDCDDTLADVFPGAPELCDARDNDCDAAVDEDQDGDGFPTCVDCVEGDARFFPGATPVCDPDSVDDDCDGVTDDNETDLDGDGLTGCAGDCAPTDPDRFPGNVEACDGLDNDCDFAVDQFDSDTDQDGDGSSYCDPEPDCDDSSALTRPGAAELCGDLADNDCDLLIDEPAPGLPQAEDLLAHVEFDGVDAALVVYPSFSATSVGSAIDTMPAGSGLNWSGLDIADLDGDGVDDIVASDASGVWRYRARCDGSGWDPEPLIVGGGALAAAVPLAEGEAPSLILVDPAGGSTVWPPAGLAVDGSVQFGTPLPLPLGFDPALGQLARGAADLTGDGLLDLVWCQPGAVDGSCQVLAGDGAGGFLGLTPFSTPGLNAGSVALGDMDGDGLVDLVVGPGAAGDPGQIAFARGTALGLDPSTWLPAFDQSPSDFTAVEEDERGWIALHDWTGDGRLDLALAWERDEDGSRSLDLLRGIGGGTLILQALVDGPVPRSGSDNASPELIAGP